MVEITCIVYPVPNDLVLQFVSLIKCLNALLIILEQYNYGLKKRRQTGVQTGVLSKSLHTIARHLMPTSALGAAHRYFASSVLPALRWSM